MREMELLLMLFCCISLMLMLAPKRAYAQTLPDKQQILDNMVLANAFFMNKWPDPTLDMVTDRVRPSNIWTRATYYEGLMALYRITRDPALYKYALDWATFHQWGLRNGNTTRNADDQCCGQVYIEMYHIDPQPERLTNITKCIKNVMNSPQRDDWWWIDAIQMAMPIYAKLGVLYNDPAYFQTMYELYAYTKNKHGDAGLYNPADHLWWRDKDFDPPYTEPNGEDCYWSRGNGWVLAALARVLEVLPATDPHRAEYLQDFTDMAAALKPLQRDDGFWNVSLHDPTNYGGKETTGTAFFVYGIAWGINQGILSATEYQPVVVKGWNAMISDALHPNGFLGFVQGTGKQPSDSQPVTYDRVPNHDDFGVGAFLLAGSAMYTLAEKTVK